MLGSLEVELAGGGKRGSSAEAFDSKRIFGVEIRCPARKKSEPSEFRGMRNTVLHSCCKLGVLVLCLNSEGIPDIPNLSL